MKPAGGALYPTRRAIALMAAGAPLALLLALFLPRLWVLGLAWILFVLLLIAADLALGARRKGLALNLDLPGAVGLDDRAEAVFRPAFRGRAPASLELALQVDPLLAASPARQVFSDTARVTLAPQRRGEASLPMAWLRWRGPLGLVWRQQSFGPGPRIKIFPGTKAVTDFAMRLFSRHAPPGQRVQQQIGDSAEFHALKEFGAGGSLRSIAWRQSARHVRLLARESHAETNHHVVLALDTGRLMCAPMEGLPKLDHALHAALLLAYVALRGGDRVGLFAFDAQPVLSSGALVGPAAFPTLQRLAASLEYSTEETNFTLGLARLGGELKRRSLVVVFTDFADTTGAELMLENVGRLMARHLVLFVALRDAELEALAEAAPRRSDDVSRAVVAGAMLQERELVMEKLRHLGVQVIQASARELGPALIDRYDALKRRDAL
ncbi:DUF58 domain-containing protein [Roseomonas sp. USHLN139]|uniref:DUF58 domain-containing protein n=1 Tax=Roseomonas sp. USHLN139 TaxID=3081298 RepID=UPI003B012AE9